jgi:hypothetical protein
MELPEETATYIARQAAIEALAEDILIAKQQVSERNCYSCEQEISLLDLGLLFSFSIGDLARNATLAGHIRARRLCSAGC